jgi:Holliday junction resolvase
VWLKLVVLKWGETDSSGVEIIDTINTHEKAQAILTEAKVRTERELKLEKEKTHQMRRYHKYAPEPEDQQL